MFFEVEDKFSRLCFFFLEEEDFVRYLLEFIKLLKNILVLNVSAVFKLSSIQYELSSTFILFKSLEVFISKL